MSSSRDKTTGKSQAESRSGTFKLLRQASEEAIKNPTPKRLSFRLDLESLPKVDEGRQTTPNMSQSTPPNSRMPTPEGAEKSSARFKQFHTPRVVTPKSDQAPRQNPFSPNKS